MDITRKSMHDDFVKQGYRIRAVRDSDAGGLITLIGTCFKEYADQGVQIDLGNLDRDLYSYATSLAQSRGEGFVLEKDGEIVACFSYAQETATRFELKRFYLRAAERGGDTAQHMLRYLENCVREKGAQEFHLWSDTRFTRAHNFYKREGFIQQLETRYLHDISNTTEYHFEKRF